MLYDWFARATAAIAGSSNESAAKETDAPFTSVANTSHAPIETVPPTLTTSGTLSQREQDVSNPSLLNDELNTAAAAAQDSAALPRLQKKAKKKKRDVGETGVKVSGDDKVEAASKKNKKLKSKNKPDRQAQKKKIRHHQQHFEMGQDTTEVNRERLDDERDQITHRNAGTPSVPSTLAEQVPVFSAPTNVKLARYVENVSGRCNNVNQSDKLVSNDAEISGAMRHIGRLTTLETFSPLISSHTTIPHDSSSLLVKGIKNTGDENEVVLANKKRVTPTSTATVSSAASTQQSSSSTSTSSRGLKAGTKETLLLHDSLKPRNKRIEELPRIPLPPPGLEGKLPPLPPNLEFLPPPPFLADLSTSDQRSKMLKQESTKMPVLLELRDADDAQLESKLSGDGSRLLPLEAQKLPLEQRVSLSRSSSQISPSLSPSSSQSAEMSRGSIRAPPPKLLRPVAKLNEAAQRAAVLPSNAASMPKRKMVTSPKRVVVKQLKEELSVVAKPKVTKTLVKTALKPTPPVKPQPGAALTPSANLGLLDVKQDKQFFCRFFERQATLTTRPQRTWSIQETSEATEKKKSLKTKGKKTLLKKDKKGDPKPKSKKESNWVDTLFGPRYVVNSLPCGLTLPVQFEGATTWNATRQIALQQELEGQQHRLSQAKSRLHYLHTHLYERWDIGLQSAESQRGKCCAALLNFTLDYRDRSLAQAFYQWRLQIYLCRASVKTHRRLALRTFAAVTQRHLQHHFFHLRTYCAADEEASSSTSSALPSSWGAVVRFSWPPLEHELLVRSLMHYDDVLSSFEALLNEIKHRTVCFGFSAIKAFDKRKNVKKKPTMFRF